MMASAKKILFSLVMLVGSTGIFAQNDSVFASRQLSNVGLFDVTAHTPMHLPADESAGRFSLFIFLSPECPLSQDYLPLLNRLFDRYREKVSFYGIIPGKAYQSSEIKKFQQTYHVRFPLLIDSTMALSDYLRATVTPEAILLDKKNRMQYRGAVNDWMMTLGKRRVKVTREHLQQALSESLSGKPVTVKRTKPVGCRLNDY